MEFVCGVKSMLFCNCFMLFFMLAYCVSGGVPKNIEKGKVATSTPLPVVKSTPLSVLYSNVSTTSILPVASVALVSSKSHTTFTVSRFDVTPTFTIKSSVTSTVKSTAKTTTVATTDKSSAKHSARPHHTRMNNAKRVNVFKMAVQMMMSHNLTEKAKIILEKAGLRPLEEKVLPSPSASLAGTRRIKPKSDKSSGRKHNTQSGEDPHTTSDKNLVTQSGEDPHTTSDKNPGTQSGDNSDTTSVKKPPNTPSGEDLRNGPAPAPGTSHFAVVFLVLIALLFGLYALYHNRQKIIAVVVEGRLSGGRGHRERYRKLDTKVEPEARIKNSDEVYVY